MLAVVMAILSSFSYRSVSESEEEQELEDLWVHVEQTGFARNVTKQAA